jgi:hypothetical protein
MLKNLFLGAALALGLGLATTSEASAAGPHGGHHGPARPYYQSAGHKFAGGYYYRGYNHPHWGPRVWNARYGRYHYWDPYLKCYYYWSPAQACYFPVGAVVPF